MFLTVVISDFLLLENQQVLSPAGPGLAASPRREHDSAALPGLRGF